tara:strand:- start:1247 stop:2014 length:768 start_codon:yes stop_codon:yes gene_type:complete
MKKVKAKKFLGQHFLNDLKIAKKITDELSLKGYKSVLEIGPGMGVLTNFIKTKKTDFYVIEIDNDSVLYLKNKYPELSEKIIEGDFLTLNIDDVFNEKIAIIGNFPYNISSQILFKSLNYTDKIVEIIGMFQKEVAERITSKPGNKKYGILSVLMQTYYNVEYLFTVDENVFSPPPKVKSGVIKLIKKNDLKINFHHEKLIKIVKIAFNQRRKTLRNALKSLTLLDDKMVKPFLSKRAEELSSEDYIKLTKGFEI